MQTRLMTTRDGKHVRAGGVVYGPDGKAYKVRDDMTIAAAVFVADGGGWWYRDLLAQECWSTAEAAYAVAAKEGSAG